jgi:hypothetical protein
MTDQHDKLRGGDGKFTRDPATAESDARAAELRAEGKTYRQIAAAMGWSHPQSAHDAVARAMAEIVAEPAAAAVQFELDRLDLAYRKTLAVLEGHHVTVSNGRVVVLDGEPLQDDGPVLAAVDRLVRISESRRKLLGLDSPTKMAVSGGLTYEVIGIDTEALK